MIKQQMKLFLASKPKLKTTAFIATDLWKGLQMTLGKIDTKSGMAHANYSTKESIKYIEEVFNDYKKYGEFEQFYGVAAEIGPGDNAGVALLMRQDGCQQVDLIDRYYSRRNREQQNKIYDSLGHKYKLDNLKTQDFWDETKIAGINWKIGQSAEDYFRKCAQEKKQIYDFIVSRAVLEHLYNPLDALQDMVTCLKPKGRMLHKIDFRDHGMFTPENQELTFLEIPSFFYPLMVRNSGRPNRILIHRYREVLERLKKQGLIDYSILVTHLVDAGEISPHTTFDNIDLKKQNKAINFVEKYKHKLATEFIDLDSQDLAVSGVFLKVVKLI
ncbi:MAG TPA: hypothetical protein DCF68_22785 [Cyanothece sp. UBA12306]|nr:hypothetical protein [Cyanothece sp. UBA12306]